VRRLRDLLTDLRVSSFWITEPIGGPPQPDYLNAVAVGRTRLSPFELLHALTRIEDDEGRVRAERNEPRTLDLDLLLYGTRAMRTRLLTVPHPRLAGRRFALAPLAELVPRRIVPGTGRTVARLLAEAPEARVRRAGSVSSSAASRRT
jgi:2-amino-4-hydroxy-6-hydroxymethyldihydropteridine diphosphokinase